MASRLTERALARLERTTVGDLYLALTAAGGFALGLRHGWCAGAARPGRPRDPLNTAANLVLCGGIGAACGPFAPPLAALYLLTELAGAPPETPEFLAGQNLTRTLRASQRTHCAMAARTALNVYVVSTFTLGGLAGAAIGAADSGPAYGRRSATRTAFEVIPCMVACAALGPVLAPFVAIDLVFS